MARTGRPTKLTRELVDAIVNSLKVGNTPKVAAALNGISGETFYAWKSKGDDDADLGKHTLLAEFSDRTSRAIAEAEQSLVCVPMARAAKNGDLRAAQFLATHRFGWKPERNEVDITTGGQPLGQLMVLAPSDTPEPK